MTRQGQKTAIAPLLSVREGARAIGFYREAFGAEVLFRVDAEDGAVVARLDVDGAEFWLADESPEHIEFQPPDPRRRLGADDPERRRSRCGVRSRRRRGSVRNLARRRSLRLAAGPGRRPVSGTTGRSAGRWRAEGDRSTKSKGNPPDFPASTLLGRVVGRSSAAAGGNEVESLIRVSEFKLTDLLSSAGATIGVIIAGTIFLQFLSTKYAELAGRYRELAGEYRTREESEPRHDPLRILIRAYRRRLRLMNRASALAAVALLCNLLAILAGGLSLLYPPQRFFKYLGTPRPLLGPLPHGRGDPPRTRRDPPRPPRARRRDRRPRRADAVRLTRSRRRHSDAFARGRAPFSCSRQAIGRVASFFRIMIWPA